MGATYDSESVEITPNGFKIVNTTAEFNANSRVYIYMAVRGDGGRIAPEPEYATDFFQVKSRVGNNNTIYDEVIIRPDVAVVKMTTGDGWYATHRYFDTLYNEYFRLDSTIENKVNGGQIGIGRDKSNTIYHGGNQIGGNRSGYNYLDLVWKNTRGAFDSFAYSAEDNIQEISHDLGKQPQMIWFQQIKGTNNQPVHVWHIDAYHYSWTNFVPNRNWSFGPQCRVSE